MATTLKERLIFCASCVKSEEFPSFGHPTQTICMKIHWSLFGAIQSAWYQIERPFQDRPSRNRTQEAAGPGHCISAPVSQI